MSVYKNNFKALPANNPAIADWIEKASAPEIVGITVESSRSGLPVPKLNGVSLHSSYHPEKEAEQFAAANTFSGGGACVVFGFGFGYHLQNIAESAREIIVIEPCAEMVKAAMQSRDISALLEKITIVPPEAFSGMWGKIKWGQTCWLDHEPSARIHSKIRKSLFEPFNVHSIATARKYRAMVVGPVYGGSVPTAASTARALKELGFTVDFMDNTSHAAELSSIADVTADKDHQAVLKAMFNNYLGESVAARAENFKPDFIIALAQAPLSPQLIDRLREGLRIPIIFWFVENHRAIPYWSAVAPHYDYFFAMQKGEFLEKLQAAGARYSAYLPQAADNFVHHPAQLAGDEIKKYGSPVSFMGAGYPNRRKFFNSLLDTPLAIWGTEWDLSTPLGQRVKNANRRLSPEEYAKIFLASEINLNLHSSTTSAGIDPLKDFVNPRAFEVAACGAFQLVDSRDELPEMFNIGQELITFDTLDELREKTEYYLNHPDERKKIAKAGMLRVLKEHTFVHRLAYMMTMVIPREEARISEARAMRRGINDVDAMIEKSQDDELKKFLVKFKGEGNLSLKRVMEEISKGEGALSRPEAIFVMIDQIFQQG